MAGFIERRNGFEREKAGVGVGQDGEAPA